MVAILGASLASGRWTPFLCSRDALGDRLHVQARSVAIITNHTVTWCNRRGFQAFSLLRKFLTTSPDDRRDEDTKCVISDRRTVPTVEIIRS